MSDNAEFQKLSVLEARLALALDRIATGLGDHLDSPRPLEDPVHDSAALEEAQARADTAELQTAAVQAELHEAQTQIGEMRSLIADLQARGEAVEAEDTHAVMSALAEERDALAQRVAALESARQADQDTANRIFEDQAARIERAEAAAESAAQRLAEAEAQMRAVDAAPDPQTLEDLRDQVADQTTRIHRLRSERDEARQALATASQGDDAVEAVDAPLREEVQTLRQANQDLTETLTALQADIEADATAQTEALLVELAELKAARAAEAEDLARILHDIEVGPAPMAGGSHA